MKKRSVTLRGHRTSITLEDPFWTELTRLARAQGRSVASLIDEIDESRLHTATGGLSSALRVYILEQALAAAKRVE